MRYLLCPLALIAILSAGCVRISQDLTLYQDGSGTMDFMYAVKEQDLKRMREWADRMAALDPEMSQEDVDWMTAFDEKVIREEWENSKHEGVVLVDVKTGMENGWRIMKSRVNFRSLQHLLDCGMIEDCHIALTRAPNGHYGYQQSINVEKMSESLPAGMDMQSMRPLASMLFGDFQADVRFNAPGTILRSNADVVDGKSARWRISGSEKGFMDRLQEFDVRLMFDGKGLKIADAVMLK